MEHEELRQAIVMKLHEQFGICGHCGKKKCAGRREHSTLPEKLPVQAVLDAIYKTAQPQTR